MSLRYAVVVTTDGRPDVLASTLASLDARVTPRPEQAYVVDDSGDPLYRSYLDSLLPDFFPRYQIVSHGERLGFCRSVADGWRFAAISPYDWIFWLEDDFVFLRAVDLAELANVLLAVPELAQMALYRGPVNEDERRAGGYLNLYPESYERRGTSRPWWETTRNWTTNVSLFRRQIAESHAWPTEPLCEGLFGFQIREERPGTTFGIWGNGEPWIAHIGERVGTGY